MKCEDRIFDRRKRRCFTDGLFARCMLVAAVLCVVTAAGCRELAVPPAGSYSEVMLVTEDGDGGRWNDAVAALLTKEHEYVLERESAFRLTPVRAQELEDFPVVKNIVIVGVAAPSTDVGQRIISLIGADAYERVRNGEANILKKDNLPSPGQLTMIVTARDDRALETVIAERGEELPEVIERSCRERLRRHLLASPNTRIRDRLFRTYGFVIEVPLLYRLLSEELDPAGVELIREPPTRILGVFWKDWDEAPTLYDADALFELRGDYVYERYDTDKMERERVSFSYDRLGPYDAVKMAGYWYNDKVIAGGYFETYFIYDEPDELLWAVDLLTYAPGRPKHPLVRELRALGETFRYD